MNLFANFGSTPLWYKATIMITTLLFIVFVFIGITRPPALSEALQKHAPLVGAKAWDRDIYYFNESGYNKTLQAAIERWEETGIPITFIKTEDKDSADIVISDDEKRLAEACKSDGGCLGHAPIGMRAINLSDQYLYIAPPLHHGPFFKNEKIEPIIDKTRIRTMIHELGHILGLWHDEESECSVMSPTASDCYNDWGLRVTKKGTYFDCGPSPDDVEKIRDLYKVESDKPISSQCLDREATTDSVLKSPNW